jgi:hypothetical protein
MIGNLLNILLGLWLAYSAIFAHPAGDMNIAALAAGAVAVIAFAAWARRTDPMGWPSGTNLVLGTVLLVVAAARWAVYAPPLLSFWVLLLVGIAIAIVAMWSMLYRPDTPRSRVST